MLLTTMCHAPLHRTDGRIKVDYQFSMQDEMAAFKHHYFCHTYTDIRSGARNVNSCEEFRVAATIPVSIMLYRKSPYSVGWKERKATTRYTLTHKILSQSVIFPAVKSRMLKIQSSGMLYRVDCLICYRLSEGM
jgi:hypothetical protein